MILELIILLCILMLVVISFSSIIDTIFLDNGECDGTRMAIDGTELNIY